MSRHRTRVLVNAVHAKSGGGATYIANMIPKFARCNEIDVHVAVTGRQDGSAYQDDGITVHRVDAPDGLIPLALFEQWHITRLARRIGADVVFSPANYGPVLAGRTVVMLRNAMGVGLLDRRWRQRLYWAALYVATLISIVAARRVVVISEFALRSGGRLVESLARRKADVIHSGVDPMFEPPGADRPREAFVLCVSDLYVQKNLLCLLDALGRLKGRGLALDVRVAGGPVDRAYAERLERRAEELGVADQVAFLGSIGPAELVRLYQSCAMFVFPSLVETFGNPLVEAMACGAPVAASNAAAMPEVAGDAALFFDPADPDALADAMERLHKDETLRTSLSAKAIDRARAFSWDTTARRTIEVLLSAARP